MAEVQWVVRDQAAEAALLETLNGAAADLAGLPEPALVAACPFKHNDAGNFSDEWLAVQAGRARWERTVWGIAVEEQALNPDDLVTARATLRRLEARGWRALTERMFAVKLGDEVLGLVRQHGAYWLVIAGTCSGEDAAFLLDQVAGRLLHVGKAERLDQQLGDPRPLALRSIMPSAWRELHAAAPAFPAVLPEPSTPEAHEARCRLAEMFGAASTLIRVIPGSLRYASTAHRLSNYSKSRGWRVVAADGAKVNNEYMLTLAGQVDEGRYRQEVARGGRSLGALDGLLDVLDTANLGDLFVAGVMPLRSADSIALLAHGSEVWLVAAGAVFGLDVNGSIALVGACDELDSGSNVSRAVIHLFDGRSLAPPEPPQAPSRTPNPGSFTIYNQT